MSNKNDCSLQGGGYFAKIKHNLATFGLNLVTIWRLLLAEICQGFFGTNVSDLALHLSEFAMNSSIFAIISRWNFWLFYDDTYLSIFAWNFSILKELEIRKKWGFFCLQIGFKIKLKRLDRVSRQKNRYNQGMAPVANFDIWSRHCGAICWGCVILKVPFKMFAINLRL